MKVVRIGREKEGKKPVKEQGERRNGKKEIRGKNKIG